MHKLSDIWEKRNVYTRCASEQARALCFAGLAVVWIFRIPNDNDSSAVPVWLIWCALGFIVGLALDLSQYLVGAYRVGKVAHSIEAKLRKAGKEPKDAADELYDYPDGHPDPMDRLWFAKVSVTSVAWLALLVYVATVALHAGLPKID
jgi:hypothetical protein